MFLSLVRIERIAFLASVDQGVIRISHPTVVLKRVCLFLERIIVLVRMVVGALTQHWPVNLQLGHIFLLLRPPICLIAFWLSFTFALVNSVIFFELTVCLLRKIETIRIYDIALSQIRRSVAELLQHQCVLFVEIRNGSPAASNKSGLCLSAAH